ncbi:MAG: helix-turn-helix domain-containing protein [Verrucomicrobiae bacterium]|nr:helix-turn-helix domain-containing protein [Verrucomicrobiae bacterium]
MARRRGVLGWSQAELARRAAIPRTTLSAIEGDRLTPSVRTALCLSHVLDCSVEELFGDAGAEDSASMVQWAWTPRCEPSRYWEAEVSGRRWWYPAECLGANGLQHDGVWDGKRGGAADASLAMSTLVMATCDPAAGLTAREYARASGYRLLVFSRGGCEALDLLKRGLVHVAGVHRSTPEHPDRNAEMVRSLLGNAFGCVRAAEWTSGLALASDNPSRSPEATLKTARRWALREAGSAARECLDELSGGLGLPGRTVSSHGAVAEAVRSGWADAGICVRLCAEEAGLNFLPVRTELLDLYFPRALERDPRLVALVRLLRSASHQRLIGELPGYDTRHSGEFITN